VVGGVLLRTWLVAHMQFLPRYLERRYGGEAQTTCEWGYSLTFALHKCATLDPQLRLFLRLLDGTASDALFHDLCQMQAALHTACQQAEVGHLRSSLPSAHRMSTERCRGFQQAACEYRRRTANGWSSAVHKLLLK